jgi:SNF2 family DNA or RNA helicase
MDEYTMRKVNCPVHGIVRGERSVKNYMSMTGTPILNKPEEIFSSLHLCRDDLFPDLNEFRYEYCYKTYDGKWMWTTGGESRLVNKIKGMYLRRSIADAGIVLPPQDIQVHDIKLDPIAYKKQAEILQTLVRDAQIRINEKEAVGINHVMALITRQRQATVWPGGIKLKYYDKALDIIEEKYVGDEFLESQKLDWACDLMDEFDESGIRYVVFSQFREPLIELGRRRGSKVVEFHGGTPINQRADIKRNFDRSLGEKPKWNGVLAHYRLGGEGLNLTAATQTIILDEQWSPGMNTQAYKRTQRMGQTEDTGVHIGRLVGKGSLDSWMAELIAEKAKMIEGFDTEITFAQLAELFDKSA